MVRPFRSEVVRYGEYSKAGEFVYDHPFLWGSKRTGPDLAREGVSGKPNNGGRSDDWHFNHLWDPQSTSSGSIMPGYKWIIRNTLDTSKTQEKMKVMQQLGVPYTDEEVKNAYKIMDEQASKIEANLMKNNDIKKSFDEQKATTGNEFVPVKDREITALIAYLQRLGTDITKENNTKK